MDESPRKWYSGIQNIYENHYKKLLIIPFVMLAIALILIGMKFASTGQIMDRDVSLKGGVTITLNTGQHVDLAQLENSLAEKFPGNDIGTKSISSFGAQSGIIIEADITESQARQLIEETGKFLGRELKQEDYAVEIIGSSLGASFFKDLSIAMVIAFGFMAVVVFLYFRTLVPSAAVILAAFTDIIVTLAIVNLFGMKISAAGIAAFLMLIGYSVDTDILLTTRLIKRREDTEMKRIYGAISTGMVMTSTTLVAITIALFVSQSDIIRQIMTILIIGLFVDMITTWIQNVGLLRLYLERKHRKATQNV